MVGVVKEEGKTVMVGVVVAVMVVKEEKKRW